MVETFETLLRTWSVQGRSVRPDHRMVAHSGFITVARKVEPGLLDSVNKQEAESQGISEEASGNRGEEHTR
ncbi:MAG: hypothetical protein HP477_00955 [Nitrospira sp.]|nr:hypothetical protein [Nitrospira sp.]